MQLEDLFGSKNKIKLLRYLVNHPEFQFNLSEVSKKISLDKGTTSKLINELSDYLEIKRSGKLLIFRLSPDYQKKCKVIFGVEK